MSQIYVYGHQNRGNPYSTFTALVSLNIRLDALEEYIMASFIILPVTRNTTAIRLLDPHGISNVFIHESPVHSNITHYITCKISKLRLIQDWDDHNLTQTSDWDGICPTFFKRARDTTTVHMAHFITKYMSNTLPNMTILQKRRRTTT